MKNKQMTAVEWLEKELYEWAGGRFYFPPHFFEKAKEMEKEQIIDAHLNGQSEFDTDAYRYEVVANAEEYYNETFIKKINSFKK